MNRNLVDYSLQDIIKSSKWSDCSYDKVFNHTNSLNNNESNNNAKSPKNNKNNCNTYRNINNNYHLLDTSFTTTPPPATNVIPTAICGLGIAARTQNTATERIITLANHSKNSSFVAVTPSTSSSSNSSSTSSSMIYESSSTSNADKNAVQLNENDTDTETLENLLTSERTHFRPIKHTYVDGHTFKISITPYNIEYNRSESGFSCLDSEKYLEFKPIKNVEDVVQNQSTSDDENESKCESIKIMFCYKTNDKSCQTDQMNMDSFYLKMQNNLNQYQCINEKMENFHELEMDMNWRNDGMNSMTTTGNDTMFMIRNNEKLATMQQQQSSNSYYMEGGDTNKNSSLFGSKMNLDNSVEYNSIETWNISEKNKICPDNNNSHSLWEHCPTCGNTNDVFTSLPANRLLKDELSADGDEIMSDLKYMQNLYIGDDDIDDNADEIPTNNDIWGNALPFEMIDGKKINKEIYQYNQYLSSLLRPEPTQILTEFLSKSIIDTKNFITEQHQKQNFNMNDMKNSAHYDNTFNTNHENGIWNTDENHNESEYGYEILQNVKNSSTVTNNNNKKIKQQYGDDGVNFEKFQDICLLSLNTENMKQHNVQQSNHSRYDRKRRHSACQNICNTKLTTIAAKNNEMDTVKNITFDNINNNNKMNNDIINMTEPTTTITSDHSHKNNLSVFLKFEKLISIEYVDAMYLNRFESNLPLNIDELTHAEISRPLTR